MGRRCQQRSAYWPIAFRPAINLPPLVDEKQRQVPCGSNVSREEVEQSAGNLRAALVRFHLEDDSSFGAQSACKEARNRFSNQHHLANCQSVSQSRILGRR